MLHIDGATILRLSLKPVGAVAPRTLWHWETGIRQKGVLLMYADVQAYVKGLFNGWSRS